MTGRVEKEKPPFSRGPFHLTRLRAPAYPSVRSRHPKPAPETARGSEELLFLLFAGLLLHIRLKLTFGFDSLGCRFLFYWHRHLLLTRDRFRLTGNKTYEWRSYQATRRTRL